MRCIPLVGTVHLGTLRLPRLESPESTRREGKTQDTQKNQVSFSFFQYLSETVSLCSVCFMRTATHGTYIMHKASPGLHYRVYIYIYMRVLIKIPLSGNGHSSRIKNLLSQNFRELHVYLSRGPCWPTTPLIKIRSPPAKLRQRITDHFLIAFKHAASITESLLRADCC